MNKDVYVGTGIYRRVKLKIKSINLNTQIIPIQWTKKFIDNVLNIRNIDSVYLGEFKFQTLSYNNKKILLFEPESTLSYKIKYYQESCKNNNGFVIVNSLDKIEMLEYSVAKVFGDEDIIEVYHLQKVLH